MAGSGTAHLRDAGAILRAERLVVEFPAAHGQKVHAVSDVSLDVLPGETVGLVGESGCGKSTSGHALVQLVRPTGGRVEFEGRDLTEMGGQELKETRARLQMIFQDPIASLNPWRKIVDIVAEPLKIWNKGDRQSRLAAAREMLDSVGIDPHVAGERRAAELSGGQCQRVSIARALMLDPQVIICDEPVAALDVSVQAQIINLLQDMRDRYQLALIFIAHDLSVVRKVSDRILVMYLGKICEVASSETLFARPRHPYTALLLAAIPNPDPNVAPVRIAGIEMEFPSPLDPPSGCRFRTRCPKAQDRCASEEPEIRELAEGQFVACHFPLEENGSENLYVTTDVDIHSGVPPTPHPLPV